uniref:hypothetical protein n=1 Tax=Enterocloster clostridioformis TaxID=1531 RepID=UPI002A832793|nr:hypothetical protein [Enterocloster clostridioformis]
MEELKHLFQELFVILEENGDSSYNPQRRILKRVLDIIEENDNNIDKFAEVSCEYKKLFSPKSGLSEFYVWKNDFTERKNINDSLNNIKTRLWEILG